MALAHMRGVGKALMDAGLLVQRGSAMSVVAEDDLDDTPTSVIAHPITGHHGHLGNAAWHDEQASARRRVYALDMAAAARRVVARLDCSLAKDPVPYLDGAVLDFGTARLPKRRARVGIWVARGLTTPAVFEEYRQLVARRPADGLRVVLVLDPPDRHRFRFVRGHEFVALADVVDHEDGLFLGAEYANRDGSNERRDIVQPCLCVYGTTTPLHFWGALQGANVVDGSLARFIILPSDEDYPDENRRAGLRTSPRPLIEGLQRLAAGGGASGNLAGRTSGPETAVDPMTVPMDDDAQARFDALGEEITAELRAAAGTFHTPILARIAENAAKVALVLAVGRDPVHPIIGVEDAGWAIDFVRHFARRTIDAVERHVADTETEAHLKRLREIIRKAGAAGVTKSELTRASQWLRARDRDDILLTLVESGDIATVEQETGGRKAMRFRAMR